MKSHHFEFLRQRASTLVDIAALAEKYWHSDPESCAVKLRAFAEHLVEGL
jgi:type I restriction enzyme R subunit